MYLYDCVPHCRSMIITFDLRLLVSSCFRIVTCTEPPSVARSMILLPPEVIDDSEFEEGQKDEPRPSPHPNVYCLHVGWLREVLLDIFKVNWGLIQGLVNWNWIHNSWLNWGGLTCGFMGDREEGRDAKGHSSRNRVHVHPERDPGYEHHQNGGQMTLDKMESQWPRQVEDSHDAAVVAWKIMTFHT